MQKNKLRLILAFPFCLSVQMEVYPIDFPTVPQTFNPLQQHDIQPLSATVNKACTDYLKSKGFHDIQLLTVIDWEEHFDSSDTIVRALTYPEIAPRSIYISSHMSNSIETAINEPIKKGLRCSDVQMALPAYDKFVLLHELGHLHPYGCDYHAQTMKSQRLLMSGLFLTIIGSQCLMFSNTKYKVARKVLIHSAITALITGAISLGGAALVYWSKILSIKKKFKKWTFRHVDTEFQEHIKKACEEADADCFAIALLSDEELLEIHDYFLQENPDIVVGESWYHPTSHDRIANIVLELERRKI